MVWVQSTPRSLLLQSGVGHPVIVKVFLTTSVECRIAGQLLGEVPWPKGSRWRGKRRMWETLHFVPLADGLPVNGLLHVASHPHVAALVMRRLMPLSQLSLWAHKDIRALLHVAASLAQVRSTCVGVSGSCRDYRAGVHV